MTKMVWIVNSSCYLNDENKMAKNAGATFLYAFF